MGKTALNGVPTMCHKASKVSAYDAVPCCSFSCVKLDNPVSTLRIFVWCIDKYLSLDMLGDVLGLDQLENCLSLACMDVPSRC